ncbi:hypothetical protein PVAP13_6NG361200 [Panicum virgatum]|uniref:Homoserine dehydrogenase n=1 Tax=Panicum virgatum TaxID=38727 RepID=A0A8T0R5Z7_PANVG|nr:hypothetical protein PVAP13_6NG361200 [Panicum virgatum]
MSITPLPPSPEDPGRLLADSPGGGGVQAAASSGPREIDLRTSPSDANADAGEVGAARLRRRRPLPPPPHRLLPAAPRQPLHLGLDDALLTHLCTAKTAGSPLSSLLGLGHCRLFNNPEATSQVTDAATTLARTTGLVLVDCSATYDTVSLLKDAVDHGCCIVLANKKPLTGAYEDFQKLVSNFRRIRFESTVGAGLPVIASVTRIIASGDPVSRIVGSLSGTLGYVMSELEEGKRFSEVVKTAKSLGYTEPDPRDDLGGMDVARKVESLYPRELGPDTTSTKDFLESGLEKLDKSMEEKVKAASSRGNVLRYVCEIESTGCQVGLKELPKDSALGRLRGSDNVLQERMHRKAGSSAAPINQIEGESRKCTELKSKTASSSNHSLQCSALVGRSETEDACHHGLVEPTINTKEAMDAINSMFLEPLEPETMLKRRSKRENPNHNQQASAFDIFVDENEPNGNDPNRLHNNRMKEGHPNFSQQTRGFEIFVDQDGPNGNDQNAGQNRNSDKENVKLNHEKAGFEIYVDEDEANDNVQNAMWHKNNKHPPRPLCDASRHQCESTFQKPFVGGLAILKDDDEEQSGRSDEGIKINSRTVQTTHDNNSLLRPVQYSGTGYHEGSHHADSGLREDTVIHRFVGSTIVDEPRVENACHHGLVEPTSGGSRLEREGGAQLHTVHLQH